VLEQGPTASERARALARLPEVHRRARARRRVRVAVLAAGTILVALAVGLPVALVGSPGSQVVHVIGPGPASSTPALTAPAMSITGGGGAGAPTSRPVAQLRGSDTQSADDFGAAVAISGSTAVVGAPGHGGGRAYVFTATAAGWTQTAEIQGSDTAAGDNFGSGDNFGVAVAISGSTAVVGAPRRGGGRAYVFTRTAAGWTQTAELKGSDTAENDEFGTALALSGATLVVSAPGHAIAAGRVYVFVDTAGGWKQTAELKGADSAADDGFGASVVVSGPTVAVSAPFRTASGGKEAGAVYVFTRTARGWIQKDELVGDLNTYGPVYLGEYLAVSGGSLLVVTANSEHTGIMGNIFVFSESGQGWRPAGHLTVPGFGDTSAGAVAMAGSRAVLGFGYGTPGHGALLLDKTATGLKLAGVLNASNQDLSVGSVAMTDSTVIAGATTGVFVFNI
jgi:FG-GAP repeat